MNSWGLLALQKVNHTREKALLGCSRGKLLVVPRPSGICSAWCIWSLLALSQGAEPRGVKFEWRDFRKCATRRRLLSQNPPEKMSGTTLCQSSKSGTTNWTLVHTTMVSRHYRVVSLLRHCVLVWLGVAFSRPGAGWTFGGRRQEVGSFNLLPCFEGREGCWQA